MHQVADSTVLWCPPDPGARHHRLTTDAEREAASRFTHAADRDRRLTARVLARRFAAERLGVDPATVEIGTEPRGRPVLVHAEGRPLHLSITHAGDLVGVALADQPIGIDVEVVSAMAPVLTSGVVWTARELADLGDLPLPRRLTTAATWWTAKEAVLKSLGRGLLDPAEMLEIRGSITPWQALDVGDDHAAAIAARDMQTLQAAVYRLADVDDLPVREVPAPLGHHPGQK